MNPINPIYAFVLDIEREKAHAFYKLLCNSKSITISKVPERNLILVEYFHQCYCFFKAEKSISVLSKLMREK